LKLETKKKKKLILESTKGSRNQTMEEKIIAIAEVEQDETCSDTIREE
jgi:hypothetical protein